MEEKVLKLIYAGPILAALIKQYSTTKENWEEYCVNKTCELVKQLEANLQ